jgi:hypothetical protein
MKYWEIIADNLSKAGWSWSCVSAVDCSWPPYVAKNLAATLTGVALCAGRACIGGWGCHGQPPEMNISEGTVTAHATRHRWSQQIQVVTREPTVMQSDAVAPVQSLQPVAIALAHGREVGVDLESIHRLDDWSLLAERIFSSRELCELRALPASKQREAFFNGWTRSDSRGIRTQERLLFLPRRSIATSSPLSTKFIKC